MINVTINYRWLFFNRTKTIQVPDKWEDLTRDQFAVCAALYVTNVMEADFLARFYGVRKRLLKRLTSFELYKLTSLADFALTPSAVTNFFFVKEIPGTSLLSPGPRLRGISYEHFSLFDTFFFDYTEKPTPESLARFIAALYLKKKEVITDIDFEKRVNYILRKVDQPTQHAIFLNYIFIHKWLSKSFPFIFEEKEPSAEESLTVKRKRPVKAVRPDWNAILDSLVGDDIINYDKYKDVAAIVVFKTINNKIKTLKKHGK